MLDGQIGVFSILLDNLNAIQSKKWVPLSVSLQTGKVLRNASVDAGGKFYLKVEKRTVVESVEADYLLIASGSSQQVLMDVHLHHHVCNWDSW